MPDLQIAGVMRSGEFSPNHIGNDALIFNTVADQLRKRGYTVNIYSEEQFMDLEITEPIVLNMCRRLSSIKKLQTLEDAGKLVINSGYGIENCTRERMTRILLGNGIPYPESLIVDTDENVIPQLKAGGYGEVWVKRAETHSQHKEDVSYCRHHEETQEVLQEYFMRGIRRAVINRHLEGDLVKFYGVRDNGFFYYFYPYFGHHEKYGLDRINGEPEKVPFDVELLKRTCQKASEVIGIEIYGGDCIVGHDGSFSIIDFNDWPSFAPCRKEGAQNIARHIVKLIKKYQGQ